MPQDSSINNDSTIYNNDAMIEYSSIKVCSLKSKPSGGINVIKIKRMSLPCSRLSFSWELVPAQVQVLGSAGTHHVAYCCAPRQQDQSCYVLVSSWSYSVESVASRVHLSWGDKNCLVGFSLKQSHLIKKKNYDYEIAFPFFSINSLSFMNRLFLMTRTWQRKLPLQHLCFEILLVHKL